MSKQEAGEMIILGWDNAPGEGNQLPYRILKDFDLKEEFEGFGLKRLDHEKWSGFIKHLTDNGLISREPIRHHVLSIYVDDIQEKNLPNFYEGNLGE